MEMNGTTIIRRPVEEVAKYVLNVSNDTNWRYKVDESGIRTGDSLRPGCIGFTRVGDVEVEWKILSLTPRESVKWELLNGPFKGQGGYLFESTEDGTQFTPVTHIERITTRVNLKFTSANFIAA